MINNHRRVQCNGAGRVSARTGWVSARTGGRLHDRTEVNAIPGPGCSYPRGAQTHVQILHGFGDIKLVHGGDDDGRGGEEEEEEEEDDIDNQAADPPREAPDGEVLPMDNKDTSPSHEP